MRLTLFATQPVNVGITKQGVSSIHKEGRSIITGLPCANGPVQSDLQRWRARLPNTRRCNGRFSSGILALRNFGHGQASFDFKEEYFQDSLKGTLPEDIVWMNAGSKATQERPRQKSDKEKRKEGRSEVILDLSSHFLSSPELAAKGERKEGTKIEESS